MSNPQEDFRVAILAALGHAPGRIEPGRFHRFATGGRRADDAGLCKLFDDLRGGVFGCHRQGISETWSAADRQAMNREQRAQLRRHAVPAITDRQAKQRRQWAENAKRVDQVLDWMGSDEGLTVEELAWWGTE
jgi:putative DNA primase/helicase